MLKGDVEQIDKVQQYPIVCCFGSSGSNISGTSGTDELLVICLTDLFA